MKRTIFIFYSLFILLMQVDAQFISLAGIWKFRLDPFETGISSNGVQMMPSRSTLNL